MKTKTNKTTKTTKATSKTIGELAKVIQARTTKQAIPALNTTYAGAPIPATKLFRRDMPEFKNCKAECFMAVNEKASTVCYINSYNGSPRSSFDPATYTYPIKEKVVAKKMDEMEEVDVTEWPSFVQNAHGSSSRHSRRAK